MDHKLPGSSTGSKETKKVDIVTQTRYVTAPVRLERKQISMLNPPPSGQPQQKDVEQHKRQQQPPAKPSETTATATTATTTATSDVAVTSTAAPTTTTTSVAGGTTRTAAAATTSATMASSASTQIVGEKVPLEERGSSPMPRAPRNGGSPAPVREELGTSSRLGTLPSPAKAGTIKIMASTPAPELGTRTAITTTITKDSRQEETIKLHQERTQETKTTTRTQEEQETQEEQKIRQELSKQTKQLKQTELVRTTPTAPGVGTTPTTEPVAIPAASTATPLRINEELNTLSPTTATTKQVLPPTMIVVSPALPARLEPGAEVKPARLETAQVIEFFVEQAPEETDKGLQVAEQSVRQDTTTVMEFFEGQPTRQEGVQVAARQETANVIEFFEEQDHSLEKLLQPASPQSSLLVVPGTHLHPGSGERSGSLRRERGAGGGPRSPSPSTLHASVGLHHLDNLIRLMEELSNLKDENVRLRKKCDYLETTKNLLKVRSELMTTSESSSTSASSHYHHQSPKKHKDSGHHHHHHHHHHHGRNSDTRGWSGRPRLSSAEDAEFLEISESASDHRPKRPKGAMHKRSFSTGSLEVEILDETSCVQEGRIPKSKSGKSVFAKSPKQKSKGSKWARVKKVLTGQFLYEDFGTTLKSLKEFGRSARYASVNREGGVHGFSSSPRLHRHHGHLAPGHNTSLDPELLPSHLVRSASPSTPESSFTAVAASRPSLTPGPGAVGGNGNGGEELGTDIWMGPPDWWEQYEASKKTAGAGHSEASSSDVSSVIEVKTMYLGSGQKDTERLLRVKPLTRRQSSPSLLTKDPEDDAFEDDDVEVGRPVHRSSSYKGEEMDMPKVELQGVVVVPSSVQTGGGAVGGKTERDSKKLHQKAWGRVKEMIHVRKDSVKKRKRDKDRDRDRDREESTWSQEPEETSEVDLEGLLEEQMVSEFGESIMSRSTPKTSPMVIPRTSSTGKSFSESPPQQFQGLPPSAASADMAALLAGSMSEEFAQKMFAWQEFQLRKSSSFKAPSGETEGEGPSVDGAGETQELLSSSAPVETKTKAGASPTSESPQGGETGGGAGATIPESSLPPLTPAELLLQGPNVNVEELQRRISESFSRKLQEWERRKYRRPTTPEMEHKGFGRSIRKSSEGGGLSRPKKSREEKERERLEKAREREMQKVEREQVKLEKEKNRIEKERLRTMERQAKLERMKGRLSQPDTSQGEAPAGSPPPMGRATTPMAQDAFAQHKVTADFKKKLHEWEQMKGGGLAVPGPDPAYSSSDGLTPSPQPPGITPPSFNVQRQRPRRPSKERPPPLSLTPYSADTPEERSPDDKVSDVSIGDDSTSVTEESLTKTNIASLERANSQLLKEVQRKEQEYGQLQEEVQKLNAKLDKVRQEHAAEMSRFRRELEAGTVTGPVQLEVGELESSVRELEEKIAIMENAGDQLAESMESAAIGKWQSIEGEEAVSQQLVEMIDQMKGMLVQASTSKEQTQKTMALHNFETVYSHAMKLQVQMNNLRVSQLERNKEIMLIKRQLLLQEVNNVLLQAHITRRETELYQYREARKLGTTVRRWNTFSGQGDNETRPSLLRNVSMHVDSDQTIQPLPHYMHLPPSKPNAKHDDIPYITDEDASIPTAGVAGTVTGTGTGQELKKGGALSSPSLTTPSTSCPTTTATTSRIPEKSTDRQEQHLTSTAAATTTITATTTTTATNGAVAQGRREKSGAVQPSAAAVAAASRAETGSPAVLEQTTATTTTASASTSLRAVATKTGRAITTIEGRSPEDKALTETPTQPIPRRSADTPGAGFVGTTTASTSALRDTNISQTASVMESTQSAVEEGRRQEATSASVSAQGVEIHTSQQTQPQEKPQSPKPAALRSPISRQKYFRRQQEEREKRKDRAPGSPRLLRMPAGSIGLGKPPPHPQSTQSPTATHRSKSVGDMDGLQPDTSETASPAPLREAIQRFEKRATVCETEERKIEFRKTPSPTLHLPRVGLVSRVRRLKPAAELLEESQRYRSGHSIYATRIMNRFLPAAKQSPGATAAGPPTQQDKENMGSAAGPSYVQAMVRRLSRENTPGKSSNASSATSSELSLHRTESPGRGVQSELVSHIVRKLSSSSPSRGVGDASKSPPQSPSSAHRPLKDLTNEGQVKKVTQAFSREGDVSARGGPSTTSGHSPSTATEGSAASPSDAVVSHASMPSLPLGQPEGGTAEDETARERAATYCVSEASRQQQQQADSGDSIERIAEEFLDPALLSIREGKGQKISPSSSTKSKNALCCQSSACVSSRSKQSSSSQAQKELPSSPKSQERKSKEKMGTIGVLCKQSMSFDLGVTLRAQSPEAVTVPRRPVSAESLQGPSLAPPQAGAEGGAKVKVRPSSTSSEGDAASASTTSGEQGDKRKPRSRFLDSSWLQKPKKFFKVSK